MDGGEELARAASDVMPLEDVIEEECECGVLRDPLVVEEVRCSIRV